MALWSSLSNKFIYLWFLCSKLIIYPHLSNCDPISSAKSDDLDNKFHINSNTIIRTVDSRAMGAKYLNETELPTNRACLIWCWETSSCNVAVFEVKSKGSCYLFDCGSPSNFLCKFTSHNFYISSILKTTHSYDLSDWGNQIKHENELTNLQGNGAVVNGPAPSPISLGTSTKQAIFVTPPANVSANHRNDKKCRHYQFQCINGSECIAIYNVCDGIPQCPDSSDESVDLNCPNRDDNYKSSSPSTMVLVPTQSLSNSGGKVSSAVFEALVPASASGPQNPPKTQTSHLSPIGQDPLPGNRDPGPSNMGSASKGLDRNVAWREGSESNKDNAPVQHGQKVAEGSDSQQSPFVHKHSKFVAANDPHVQYSNRYNEDYDQYPHQNPHQEQYNPYDNGYLNDRILNNQMAPDFDQGVYDGYRPEQNPYWTGQDPVRGNSYEGSDFAQPEYHGTQRQTAYPSDRADNYPSNQQPGKFSNTAANYNRPNQPQVALRGPPGDPPPRSNNRPMQRPKLQNPPQTYYVPYGDQSQRSYPSYSEPRPAQNDYIPQGSPDGEDRGYVDRPRSRPPNLEYVPKQQPKVQYKVLLPSQEPTRNILVATVSPNVLPATKQTVTLDGEHGAGPTQLPESPVAAAPQKSNNSNPGKTYYTHVGTLLEGEKMTVAELYASSTTHAHESNSAVLALTLGLCVTALLLVLVGCRMRAIRRRIARRGRSLAHDADYLVNGMYL